MSVAILQNGANPPFKPLGVGGGHIVASRLFFLLSFPCSRPLPPQMLRCANAGPSIFHLCGVHTSIQRKELCSWAERKTFSSLVLLCSFPFLSFPFLPSILPFFCLGGKHNETLEKRVDLAAVGHCTSHRFLMYPVGSLISLLFVSSYYLELMSHELRRKRKARGKQWAPTSISRSCSSTGPGKHGHYFGLPATETISGLTDHHPRIV